MKIKLGSFIVLKQKKFKPLKSGRSVVYVTNEFPFKSFNSLIKEGVYEVREASLEEKEYCYWASDNLNVIGACLSGMPYWRKHKNRNTRVSQ
jgi:hypothetical protein